MDLSQHPTRHETSRLLLRPFAAGDWTAYAEYHARPDVYAFLYTSAPSGRALRDQFERRLNTRFEADDDVYRLAVTVKEGGALVGEVLHIVRFGTHSHALICPLNRRSISLTSFSTGLLPNDLPQYNKYDT